MLAGAVSEREQDEALPLLERTHLSRPVLARLHSKQ